ncbi:MAG: glycosyltransferase family 2 protein [Chloroflexi bacterium]|nr:glycosyltransferase family 2 protein [Chloroflexota bacterium]MCL5275882.1 glycosyltransferase family 2 protein [Chloroflexota bacterium]
MPRVDIAIVNWNGLKYLQPCLDSLFAQTFLDFRVWLVDNGSTDGSTDYVKRHYPQVKLICNTENLGFASANNAAIRSGQAQYIATLNNDTTVEPAWLGALVEALDANPRAGAAASRMLFADHPTMINSAGIMVDRVGIAWDREGGMPEAMGVAQTITVFGASAGAALYRRAMLDEIGLFDEDFFAYLEDVDLAWRAQWANWEALYVPSARVYHHHSATSREGSPFKNRLLGRNKVWLIAKNYPAPHIWFYLPQIVLYDAAAVAYAMFIKRDTSPLLGRLAGIRRLPSVLRKRRSVIRRASGLEMMRRLSSIDPPWRVRDRYRHLSPKARG